MEKLLEGGTTLVIVLGGAGIGAGEMQINNKLKELKISFWSLSSDISSIMTKVRVYHQLPRFRPHYDVQAHWYQYMYSCMISRFFGKSISHLRPDP